MIWNGSDWWDFIPAAENGFVESKGATVSGSLRGRNWPSRHATLMPKALPSVCRVFSDLGVSSSKACNGDSANLSPPTSKVSTLLGMPAQDTLQVRQELLPDITKCAKSKS